MSNMSVNVLSLVFSINFLLVSFLFLYVLNEIQLSSIVFSNDFLYDFNRFPFISLSLKS